MGNFNPWRTFRTLRAATSHGQLKYYQQSGACEVVPETLGDLLMQLAKTTQASPKKLLAAIKMEFEEYNEPGISAYLTGTTLALRP